MARIHLEKTLAAPISFVFEKLSDHGNYKAFRGIRSSEVIEPGEAEPNGRGALRRISTGPTTFTERITEFNRPTRMDYLIEEVNAPMIHHGGTIALTPAGEGTHVVWISTFDLTTRVGAKPLGAIGAAFFKQAFAGVLRDIDRFHRAP